MRFDLLLNELVRDAWISRAITLEGADMWRPFLHVRDAAAAVEAWLAAPDRDISGQVFNIAGDNIRKRDLVDLLKLVVPDLSVTLSGTAGEPRDYRVSVEKMRAILRFSPTRTTAEGVREIFDALEAGLVADPSSPRYTNLQWSHL
jgi:nucleoside-diphosphate-sugar epimerase